MRVPAEVIEALDDDQLLEWLDGLPDFVRAATFRLLTNADMRPRWGKEFTSVHLDRAAKTFEDAKCRDPWKNKTQAARNAWLAKFNKSADTLVDLMREAPITPEEWGFPASNQALIEFLGRMGHTLPDKKSPDYFELKDQVTTEADKVSFTLVDAFAHYRRRIQAAASDEQVLSKPGDKNADRDHFIVHFRNATGRPANRPPPRTRKRVDDRWLSNETIATVAAAMFEDERIDARLVRRLTSSR